MGAGIYTSEVHARIAGLLDATYKHLKDALLGDRRVKKVVEIPRPTTIDEGGVVSVVVDFGQITDDAVENNIRHLCPRIGCSQPRCSSTIILYKLRAFVKTFFAQTI